MNSLVGVTTCPSDCQPAERSRPSAWIAIAVYNCRSIRIVRTARSCNSTGLEPAVNSPDGSGKTSLGHPAVDAARPALAISRRSSLVYDMA